MSTAGHEQNLLQKKSPRASKCSQMNVGCPNGMASLTMPPPGFENSSLNCAGDIHFSPMNPTLRPDAKAFVPSTPSTLRYGAAAFKPQTDMFDAPPPPPQTTPLTVSTPSNTMTKSSLSFLPSFHPASPAHHINTLSPMAANQQGTSPRMDMTPSSSKPFPTRQARAAAAAAGVFGSAAALASPKSRQGNKGKTPMMMGGSGNMTPSIMTTPFLHGMNSTGGVTPCSMSMMNNNSNDVLKTPKTGTTRHMNMLHHNANTPANHTTKSGRAANLMMPKDLPAATPTELLSLIEPANREDESCFATKAAFDSLNTPAAATTTSGETSGATRPAVSFTRNQIQKLLFDLIASCCESQASRWSRDEDLAELESEIRQSDQGGVLYEKALLDYATNLKNKQHQSLLSVNGEYSKMHSMSSDGCSSMIDDNDDEEGSCCNDNTQGLKDEDISRRLRKREKKDIKKRKKLLLREIGKSFSDASSTHINHENNNATTPLSSSASPTNAQHLLANSLNLLSLSTSHSSASPPRPTPSELLARILSDEELDIKRQDLRNRSVGLLVSAIKTEWARRFGPSIPLGFFMKAFDYKKLKFLLEEIPNLVLIGSGGFMRVATINHAKTFSKPYPPVGVNADGKTPVSSTITQNSEDEDFSAESSLMRVKHFEEMIKANLHASRNMSSENASSVLTPSNNCNNEDVIGHVIKNPIPVIDVIRETVMKVCPMLSVPTNSSNAVQKDHTSSTCSLSGLTIPSLPSKQTAQSSFNSSTLPSVACAIPTLNEIGIVARAAGLVAAAMSAASSPAPAATVASPTANTPAVAVHVDVVTTKAIQLSVPSASPLPVQKETLEKPVVVEATPSKTVKEGHPLSLQIKRLLFGLVNQIAVPNASVANSVVTTHDSPVTMPVRVSEGGVLTEKDEDKSLIGAKWLMNDASCTSVCKTLNEDHEFSELVASKKMQNHYWIPITTIPRLWQEILQMKPLNSVINILMQNDSSVSVLSLLQDCAGLELIKYNANIYVSIESASHSIPQPAPVSTKASWNVATASQGEMSSHFVTSQQNASYSNFMMGATPSSTSHFLLNHSENIMMQQQNQQKNVNLPSHNTVSPSQRLASMMKNATVSKPSVNNAHHGLSSASHIMNNKQSFISPNPRPVNVRVPPPPPPPPTVAMPATSDVAPSADEVNEALLLLQQAQEQHARAMRILSLAQQQVPSQQQNLLPPPFNFPVQQPVSQVVAPPPGFSCPPPPLPMIAFGEESPLSDTSSSNEFLPPGLSCSIASPPGLSVVKKDVAPSPAANPTATAAPPMTQLERLVANAKKFKEQKMQQQQQEQASALKSVNHFKQPAKYQHSNDSNSHHSTQNNGMNKNQQKNVPHANSRSPRKFNSTAVEH
eukprot:GDKK01051177.1.p1 GENE.GDKK01051177.1~~GDKK01051177.1.p1  ORF type:complete len:1379 (-),score=532.10 GDKK01051177.1:740-4876(-)